MTISEVTTTLVGSLKDQPLVIGILVINAIFIVVTFFTMREVRAREHADMRLILERCIPTPAHNG